MDKQTILDEIFPVLHRLYTWTMGLSAHPHALWVLAAIAFIESSFFPIPPDVLLIPMVLAARDKAWWIATVCTVACVLAVLPATASATSSLRKLYNAWGWWIVFGAGLTPFPYKVITIASGVTQLDFLTFNVASVFGRGGRFFMVAGLLWLYGPPIRSFIERNLGLLTAAFFVLLLGGFLAARNLLLW